MGKEKKYGAIVLSLHPEWWQEIRLGHKLLEIRKTRPRGNGPYTVLVYVTGGVGVAAAGERDTVQSGTGKLLDQKTA